NLIAEVLIRTVIIRLVDVEVRGATDVTHQNHKYRDRTIARPIAIPDVIHVDRAEDHRAAVIVDPVAAASPAWPCRLVGYTAREVALAVRFELFRISVSVAVIIGTQYAHARQHDERAPNHDF